MHITAQVTDSVSESRTVPRIYMYYSTLTHYVNTHIHTAALPVARSIAKDAAVL